MYVGGNAYWPGNIMVRTGTGPLGTYSGKQVIEGVWSVEKNNVLVPASAEEGAALVESATQYYAVRNTAMRLLYVAANCNLLGNGNKLPLSAFADGTQPEIKGGWGSTGQKEIRKEMTGYKKGTALKDVTIALTAEQAAKLQDGAKVTYSIASGTLPAGLKYNASTGALTGTPTESGEFNITFRATIDNYITSDRLVKLVIEGDEAPVIDENKELKDKISELEKAQEELKNTVGTKEEIQALQDKIAKLEEEIKKLSDNSSSASGSGCNGSIGLSSVAILGSVVAASCALMKKKRNKDD